MFFDLINLLSKNVDMYQKEGFILADIIKHPTEPTSQTYYIASKPVLQKVRRDKVFWYLNGE